MSAKRLQIIHVCLLKSNLYSEFSSFYNPLLVKDASGLFPFMEKHLGSSVPISHTLLSSHVFKKASVL